MKLILIDFDDTITDSMEADYYSFIRTAAELGMKTRPILEDFGKLRKEGKLAREIIEGLIKRNDERISEIFRNVRENILNSDEFRDRIKLNEGVKDTLAYLKKRGFTIVIVTFKSDKGLIESFLKKHGIFHYIDGIFCREKSVENVTEVKRSLYIKAINHYGVEKETVTIVGNLAEDLIPARQLGIRCIGVESNYSKKEDLDKYGQAISNIKELVNIL